jgi:membrane-bound metal-dependent hydrolase YbcI (DUF457 family)
MADFKTHITASSLLGLAYGGAAYQMYNVPLPTCALAAGLCGVSGMLPDIDSGPGRPLREITTFMAAVVPVMLFERFQHLGMSAESIVLAGAGIYAAIRFGLARVLQHLTVHRGMFHSLPAAVIFGEIAFLLTSGDDTVLRWYKAGGVVLGYLSHLLLDEVYSVQWNGLPRLKKSFGTAVKIFGDSWWPNLSAYAKLAVLTFLVIWEPGLMREVRHGHGNRLLQQIANDLPGQWPDSTQAPPANIPGLKQSGDPAEPPIRIPESTQPSNEPLPQGWSGRQATLDANGRLRR